jgi:hypothetical protein
VTGMRSRVITRYSATTGMVASQAANTPASTTTISSGRTRSRHTSHTRSTEDNVLTDD